MIRYLIKNNFKLMLRNTWSLVVMLSGPILVIAALSSAFSELLKSYEGVDEFNIGYRVEQDSGISDYMELIREAGGENGITFYEYPEGEVKAVIENNDLAGFVEFTKDSYVLYQSADYEVEGIALEYFLNRVMNENVNASLLMMSPAAEGDVKLPVAQLDFMPAVDSKDYYGIIYIVYFGWCGIVCATGVLSNEKKYGIERKFRVSCLSDFQLYMSKLIPIILTAAAEMAAAALITILLFRIHWGNALVSAAIVFLMISAGTSLGMMLYNISDNLVITIVALFVVVWFMGFFGGSFETYMFSSMPDIAKQLSPIYHGNRALVELSCMGHSEYVVSAVVYSLAITVICSGIAVFAGSIRKRGKA